MNAFFLFPDNMYKTVIDATIKSDSISLTGRCPHCVHFIIQHSPITDTPTFRCLNKKECHFRWDGSQLAGVCK